MKRPVKPTTRKRAMAESALCELEVKLAAKDYELKQSLISFSEQSCRLNQEIANLSEELRAKENQINWLEARMDTICAGRDTREKYLLRKLDYLKTMVQISVDRALITMGREEV